MPGLALGVSVDLLESEFVHEGRGSRVSREQFMMVLSDIRVLHIRASYYSTVSRVLYVTHSLVLHLTITLRYDNDLRYVARQTYDKVEMS